MSEDPTRRHLPAPELPRPDEPAAPKNPSLQIDEHGIAAMAPGDVADQVRQAREATGDRRLLIGPGCVVLVATPIENLQAAVAAAREPRA